MRAYERTHKWISFRIDLGRLTPFCWFALGEAVSKCDHVSLVPLKPAIAEAMHRLYLSKGVLGTTAIEGNTLREEQVQEIIDGALDLPSSKRYLQDEVENVLRACNGIWNQIIAGQPLEPITPELIKRFNGIVLDNLPEREGVVPGEVRRVTVGVGRYRAAPWEDCEHLLERLCDWMREFTPEALGLNPVAVAILKAIIAHLYVAWIHPFGDGNGRTARLLEFRILVEAGVPSTSAHLLSNFYNLTRSEYYRHLDLSSKADDGPYEFLRYALNGFVDELRSQVTAVHAQNHQIAWQDYVYEQFRGKPGDAAKRQRDIVLALARKDEPVLRRELPSLSIEIARLYAGRGPKTVTRDINRLTRMGLIRRVASGRYEACMDIMLGFMPRVRPPAK